MKLQHTSGAVIEDERLVETERSFNFYDPTCMLMAIYLKSDWQRVPEERWEKVRLGIDGKWLRVLNEDGTVIGLTPLTNIPCVNMRYTIIDGNLCVERRVAP